MRTTEQESLYDDLENKSVSLLLSQMNQEDQKVADAVSEAIPQIQDLVEHILPRMKQGGRLFYIGAGTSGRLGILDASECPPTFGVSNNHVIGLIAGGEGAIREAVEFAEDHVDRGWEDLKDHKISDMDSVIGIAASGTTPYVVEALNTCRKENVLTGCITCNENSPLSQSAEFPVEVVVGPEFITGPANITPMGGSMGNVTYNINAVDAPSFQSLVARDPGFIHAVAMQGARSL